MWTYRRVEVGWWIFRQLDCYLDDGFPEVWKAETDSEETARFIVDACNMQEAVLREPLADLGVGIPSRW